MMTAPEQSQEPSDSLIQLLPDRTYILGKEIAHMMSLFYRCANMACWFRHWIMTDALRQHEHISLLQLHDLTVHLNSTATACNQEQLVVIIAATPNDCAIQTSNFYLSIIYANRPLLATRALSVLQQLWPARRRLTCFPCCHKQKRQVNPQKNSLTACQVAGLKVWHWRCQSKNNEQTMPS